MGRTTCCPCCCSRNGAHLGPKGEAVPLDIAPLFETGEDVERAPKIMERLLGDKLYREHLRGARRPPDRHARLLR